MRLIKHTPFIYEYSKSVPSADCDRIKMQLLKAAEGLDTTISRNKIRNNHAVSITGVSAFDGIDREINLIVGMTHQLYVTQNPLVLEYGTKQGIITELRSTYSFRYYDVSDSYEWHCDWNPGIWSVLSYVLYLDDGYTGGDLLFSRDGLRIRPGKGSVIAFPADLSHVHKSTRLRSGSKSIVYGNFFKNLR